MGSLVYLIFHTYYIAAMKADPTDIAILCIEGKVLPLFCSWPEKAEDWI